MHLVLPKTAQRFGISRKVVTRNKIDENLKKIYKMMKNHKINYIFGCSIERKKLVDKTIKWCIEKLELSDCIDLKILVKIENLGDCWGYCEQELGTNNYTIAVDQTQSLRDFIMTVVHEMIHVKQWFVNEWEGDGEEEAWGLQEQLTDELWKDDVL